MKKTSSWHYVLNNGANENIKKYIYRYFYLTNTYYLLSASLLKKFSSPQFHKKNRCNAVWKLYEWNIYRNNNNNDTSLLLICNWYLLKNDKEIVIYFFFCLVGITLSFLHKECCMGFVFFLAWSRLNVELLGKLLHLIYCFLMFNIFSV